MVPKKDTLSVQMERIDLKVQMLREARIILASVDFLENEIEKVSLQIDTAEQSYNYEALDGLKRNMLHLLRKLRNENDNMAIYMRKYKELLDDEKKKLLLSLSKAQPLPIRRIPAYAGGAHTGEALQTEVKA